MDDLEAIKRKRLEELKQQVEKQLETEQKEQQRIEESIKLIEQIALTHLSKEARTRYHTLKIAHPSVALKAATLIAQAVQFNQLNHVLTDAEFKSILKKLSKEK